MPNLFSTTEDTILQNFDYDDDLTTTWNPVINEERFSSRKSIGGSLDSPGHTSMIVQPGACLAGCQESFLIFIIISGIINW